MHAARRSLHRRGAWRSKTEDGEAREEGYIWLAKTICFVNKERPLLFTASIFERVAVMFAAGERSCSIVFVSLSRREPYSTNLGSVLMQDEVGLIASIVVLLYSSENSVP